jgi:hypothetical protein
MTFKKMWRGEDWGNDGKDGRGDHVIPPKRRAGSACHVRDTFGVHVMVSNAGVVQKHVCSCEGVYPNAAPESGLANCGERPLQALALFQIGRPAPARRILRRLGMRFHLSERLLLWDPPPLVPSPLGLSLEQYQPPSGEEGGAPLILDQALGGACALYPLNPI